MNYRNSFSFKLKILALVHLVHMKISKIIFGIISECTIELDNRMKVLLSMYTVSANRHIALGRPNFKALFVIHIFSDLLLIARVYSFICFQTGYS